MEGEAAALRQFETSPIANRSVQDRAAPNRDLRGHHAVQQPAGRPQLKVFSGAPCGLPSSYRTSETP